MPELFTQTEHDQMMADLAQQDVVITQTFKHGRIAPLSEVAAFVDDEPNFDDDLDDDELEQGKWECQRMEDARADWEELHPEEVEDA